MFCEALSGMRDEAGDGMMAQKEGGGGGGKCSSFCHGLNHCWKAGKGCRKEREDERQHSGHLASKTLLLQFLEGRSCWCKYRAAIIDI